MGWMDLEIIIRSKVSQTEKKEISYNIPYMQNLKKKKNRYERTYLQNKSKLTDLENEFTVTLGKDREKG